jgi:hypothetical protein
MNNNLIEEMFEKALLTNEVFEHKDRLYPTSSSVYVDFGKYKKLQGKCLRASYYACNGLEEIDTSSNEDKINRKFQQREGEYSERMILDILDKQGVLISKALKFELPKYKIYGKLDGIIVENDKLVGLEIKTIGGNNQYTVNDIWGSQWNKPAPRWQNLFQTLIYCYAFRGIIDHFTILYERRDTGSRKYFNISIEPIKKKIYPVIDGIVDYRYTINDMLDRYLELSKSLEEDVPPVTEYMKLYPKNDIDRYVKAGILTKKQGEKYKEEPFGDFNCAYCGFRKKCDEDD